MLSRVFGIRVVVFASILLVLLQTGSPRDVLASGASQADANATEVRVCSLPAAPAQARCGALRRTDVTGAPTKPGGLPQPVVSPAVVGNGGAYDPAYLQSAYNLATAASSLGAGTTVAIVDAYDDPSAESDLAYYRSFFGLPACASATGCFKKVNQSGVQGSYPAPNSGWAQEISLDLDMVSAICPKCSILLVEATSATFANLGTAVNTAAGLGAKVISNSYGASEFSSETSYDSYYNHPGVAITVSSGDNGYGAEYPASSQYVTAVGGTTLNQTTNTGSRNATETVWSGGGSGCSGYEPKPAWQKDGGCGNRTVADVAAVADPATGVWVYDGGWYVFGGTSVSSPIVGAVYALAGGAATYGSNPYQNPAALFDITSGSNGSCGGSYLCTAEVGYDGPTGLGTPNGYAAFAATSQSIEFSSTPQTLTAGSPSATISVQLLTAGVLTPPASPVTVTLSSTSSSGHFDTSSSGSFTATTIAVTVSTSNVSSPAFYKDTTAGSPLLTASASGYASGTQTETVTAGPLATITVSPSSASVSEGATQVFSAAGADAYGNSVSVSNGTWAVSGGTPGSVSPTTGASTTFTASSTSTGSGTVTATAGTTFGSASVTVVAGATTPGAPASLAAVTDFRRGIDLTWNAPTDNGGSTITGYRIYRSTSSGSESLYVSVTCTATTCSYRDTSTKKGLKYYYKVAAVNAVGTGPLSTEASAVAR